MPRIGHHEPRLIPGAAWAWIGALATLVPAVALWGFTVDDALISARYAHNVAAGTGWRFNAHGPSTDGVTPLPWPLLLGPIAGGDLLDVLLRAKLVGACLSVATGALLGRAIGRVAGAPEWARAGALVVFALSVPSAAYAVSGMETPVCTLLATLAAICLGRPWAPALLAGLAASIRPELAPWAFILASGSSLAVGSRTWHVLGAGLLAVVPFGACAAIRLFAFGRAAPLAVLAKPSDLEHGITYAGAALIVAVVPVLIAAPLAIARSPRAAVLVAASAAHVAALILVGGDWMPFARLLVPILPSLCLASVFIATKSSGSAGMSRIAVATLLGLGLDVAFRRVVADGRRVTADRTALVEAARPVLGSMSRVAALDIGWVGAATAADVVDLAGVTDPQIAALPGGHTSKRVGVIFLLARDPDGVVLFAPRGLGDRGLAGWQGAPYGRAVEQNLANDPVLGRHFAADAWLPVGSDGAGYVVLRATARSGAHKESIE